MRSENIVKLEGILKEHIQGKEVIRIRWRIEDLIRKDEEYNGWTNYETWLMGLILSNEEGLYNVVLELLKDYEDKSDYDKADILKDWIEEAFTLEEYDIIKVDCEYWTLRDFNEINFYEIVENFMER